MESRAKKYYMNDIETKTSPAQTTRSSRNAKLYKQVYGKYEDSDNLPIEDNTNEIDMEKLRELVLNNNSNKEDNQVKENLNILEQKKRQIDEQKLYDINKILEKAKYENNKLKEPVTTTTKSRRELLNTLESTELSLEEINEAKRKYQEQINKNQHNSSKEEELSMTRELKYKNLQSEKESIIKKELIDTNSLSLDLFEELKPTGNTIITKPIDSELGVNISKKDTIQNDIHSGDTSDIDIIKNAPPNNNTSNSSDFFTNAYEFSAKDFANNDDDDFFDTPKKGSLFKVLLLIFAIVIFIGVIIYFVGTYGLGIS